MTRGKSTASRISATNNHAKGKPIIKVSTPAAYKGRQLDFDTGTTLKQRLEAYLLAMRRGAEISESEIEIDPGEKADIENQDDQSQHKANVRP